MKIPVFMLNYGILINNAFDTVRDTNTKVYGNRQLGCGVVIRRSSLEGTQFMNLLAKLISLTHCVFFNSIVLIHNHSNL